MDSLAQDTLLGDRYRLARRIAVGGMGEVWQAEDAVLHRAVAVKVLKSEFTSDPTFLERFRTEARTTASLSHPGIANVFDYGEVASSTDIPVAYLVMEFVDGEPLSAQLARDGRLPVPRVLEVVRQAALALAEAHRVGMVHRDVKPGNLLVRRTDGAVKITDFGIARAAHAVPLTQNGMVVGTAQYFSPEQAEGRVVGPPSDVYSLGVVAYECLAGRLPFVADSPVAVAMMQIRDTPPPLPMDVPAAVRSLVLRTLAKDARLRFGTGGELAEAVRAVQEGRYELPAPGPTADGIGGTNPALAYPPPWATAPPQHAGPPPGGPRPGGGLGTGLGSGPGASPWAPAAATPPGSQGGPPPGGSLHSGPPQSGGLHSGPPQSGGLHSGVPQSGGLHTGSAQSGPPQSGSLHAGPAQSGGLHTGSAQSGGLHSGGPHGGSAQSGGLHSGAGPQSGPPQTGPAPSVPHPTGPPPPTGPRSGFPGPRPPARRRPSRWPLWIAGALLLLLAVAGVVTVLLDRGTGGDGNPSRSAGPPVAPLHSLTTDTLRVR